MIYNQTRGIALCQVYQIQYSLICKIVKWNIDACNLDFIYMHYKIGFDVHFWKLIDGK
jgi:hypothetical protein